MTASELTATALKEEFENICDDFKEYEWSTYDNFEMNEESANVIKDALNLYIKKEKCLLVELPVPIGTKFYIISNTKTEVQEVILQPYFEREWGVTAFATREEAEARLKELRNEQTDVH